MSTVSSTVDLQNVELVSTLHTAPANGAPSSSDYYDGELEKVTDLAAIATFINDNLLPVLNALPALAATGLMGTAVYSDTTAQDALVYDSLTGDPLTITDSMRVLYGQIQTVQTAVTNISQQVSALQARLSASNQNDVALALQNITSSVAQYASQVTSLANSVSGMQQLIGTMMDASVQTPVIAVSSSVTVTINWSVPFADNTYVVTYGLNDNSGQLQITGFSYLAGGVGIQVFVKNNDLVNTHQGYVNAQARSSQLAG